MDVFKGYLFGILFGALCLGLSFLLYKLGVDKRYTRKTVHILIGFEWFILNRYFGPTYHFLIFCLAFLALLLVVHRRGLMPMIASDGDNAPGTVYYCVSMCVMSFAMLFEPRFMLPFGIAVFATSLGDSFAGVIGQACKRFNPCIWKKKTLIGTLAGLLFNFLVAETFVMIYNFDQPFMSGKDLPFYTGILIALLATLLELFTGRGLDNVTLPLGVSAFSYLLFYHSDLTVDYVAPIILTPILLAVVLDKKLLTPMGTALAVILDVAVSLAFGNAGFIMMVVFLVGGVLVDKVKRLVKNSPATEAKSDRSRDAVQVVANALPAFILSVSFFVTGQSLFILAYAATVAEAFADTCGSGFGALSRHTYDLFRFRKAERGMSGGMSVIGTLAQALGALAVSLIPTAFGLYDQKSALAVAFVAFLGTLVDSLLGSLLQVKYRCSVCGKLTERREHCGEPSYRVSGVSFIDNDAVNLSSGVITALIALIVFYP